MSFICSSEQHIRVVLFAYEPPREKVKQAVLLQLNTLLPAMPSGGPVGTTLKLDYWGREVTDGYSLSNTINDGGAIDVEDEMCVQGEWF